MNKMLKKTIAILTSFIIIGAYSTTIYAAVCVPHESYQYSGYQIGETTVTADHRYVWNIIKDANGNIIKEEWRTCVFQIVTPYYLVNYRCRKCGEFTGSDVIAYPSYERGHSCK